LNKFWRGRVSDFLNKDPATLVPHHKVAQLLSEAKKIQIEPENYHVKQLEDARKKATALQKSLKEFRRFGQSSYAEAKYFFAELFTLGIYLPEADYVRDIMQSNVPIETTLSEELTREKLVELRDMILRDDQKLINTDLQQNIGMLCSEYEDLESQIKYVLNHQYCDFRDLPELEALKTLLKKSKLKISGEVEFFDLFDSYSWVIKTSLEYNIKANS
jgi:hypothetical protein